MLHDEARKRVCLTCFRKAKENECLDGASPLILQQLERHVIVSLDLTDARLPSALCHSCRTKLKNIDVSGRKSTFDVVLLSKYLHEAKRLSPRATSCDCLICKIARSYGGPAHKILKDYAQTLGRPATAESGQPHHLGGVCLAPVYRGTNHDKSQCGDTKYKIENVYNALSLSERQVFRSARVCKSVLVGRSIGPFLCPSVSNT